MSTNDDERQRAREGLGFGPRAAAEELARVRAEFRAWKRGDAYVTSAASVTDAAATTPTRGPLEVRLDTPEDRAVWETAKRAKAEVASWPAWKRGDAYVTSAVPEKPVAERFADVTEANPPLGIYSERELLEELLLRLARRTK